MLSAAQPSETNTVSASSRLVFGEQTVVTAGQPAELGVGLFEEAEDRLVEIVAARDDAVHVMLLVLHRAEQHGFFRSIISGTRRRLGPNSSRCAGVGQSIRSSGAPRNSRSNSASGARYIHRMLGALANEHPPRLRSHDRYGHR